MPARLLGLNNAAIFRDLATPLLALSYLPKSRATLVGATVEDLGLEPKKSWLTRTIL